MKNRSKTSKILEELRPPLRVLREVALLGMVRGVVLHGVVLHGVVLHGALPIFAAELPRGAAAVG